MPRTLGFNPANSWCADNFATRVPTLLPSVVSAELIVRAKPPLCVGRVTEPAPSLFSSPLAGANILLNYLLHVQRLSLPPNMSPQRIPAIKKRPAKRISSLPPAITAHANGLKAFKPQVSRRRRSPLAPDVRSTQQSSIPLLLGGALDSPARPSKRKQDARSPLQPTNLYRLNPFNNL